MRNEARISLPGPPQDLLRAAPGFSEIFALRAAQDHVGTSWGGTHQDLHDFLSQGPVQDSAKTFLQGLIEISGGPSHKDMPDPISEPHVWCEPAQSKTRWISAEPLCVREFTGKMPRLRSELCVLRGRAQSKCIRNALLLLNFGISEELFGAKISTKNSRAPEGSRAFCDRFVRACAPLLL